MLRLVVPIAAVLALLPAAAACAAPGSTTPFSARVEALIAQHLAGQRGGPAAAVALQVALRSMHTVPTLAGELSLHGEAVLARAGLDVPLRFEVVLDRASGEAVWVDVRWNEAGASGLPEPSRLAPRVSAAIGAQLAEEFDVQHSAFELDAIELLDPAEGNGHVLAVGRGTTVFVGEASVPTRFSALFDRSNGELLALRYALQGAAGTGAADPLEIAAAPTP